MADNDLQSNKYLELIKNWFSDQKNKNIAILVAIAIVSLYIVSSLFSSQEKLVEKAQEQAQNQSAIKPIQANETEDNMQIPDLPSPPQLEDPTPPEVSQLPSVTNQGTTPTQAPAPVQENDPVTTIVEEIEPIAPSMVIPALEPVVERRNNTAAIPITEDEDENKKRRTEQKKKSGIMLISGKPPTITPEKAAQDAIFSRRGDMSLTIGRGKLIDAIIESAVNSDLSTEIRAIVSRDVYSEWGKNILIPKGSRVLGEYGISKDGAYGRVSINWVRVDLANGYSINLNPAATVDNLGRIGAQGRVDDKLIERFSNAVLNSVLEVALAKVVDSLVPPPAATEATANKSALASNIKQMASDIALQKDYTDTQKRTQICASVLNVITDTTLPAYVNIKAACDKMAIDTSSDESTKLRSLVASITVESDNLLKSSSTSTQASKEQDAAKQGFTNVTDVIKSVTQSVQFKPTVTIDQGTPIKIYINKDFTFPKSAVRRK